MAFAPKILLDHSGYDLKNIGDAAQFLGANLRLRERWPDARIVTIANNLELLREIDPRLHGISLAPNLGALTATSERIRGGLALRYKRALTARSPVPLVNAVPLINEPARQLVAAMRTCDLALSSGGGFLNDDYPAHAMGVLGLLDHAQRSGAVTAMMGQGIGTFTLPQQIALAKVVLPRLDLLTVRGATSLPNVERYRPAGAILAGDDALNVAAGHVATGTSIGFNLRIADYTNLTAAVARYLGSQVRAAASTVSASIQPLPISWHLGGEDFQAVTTGLGHDHPDLKRGADVTTPQRLVDAVSRCQVVVVCSYHAALFSLSQGVPVVGLSSSDYYDSKFADLKGHFGDAMVDVVDLRAARSASTVNERIVRAAQQPEQSRAAARRAAVSMSNQVQNSYEQLFAEVEKHLSSKA